MATEKQLEELKHAKVKLEALAKAIVLVADDSTARAILAEVLAPTNDGTGTDVADLQNMLLIAYAHSHARVEVAERQKVAAQERAAGEGAAA